MQRIVVTGATSMIGIALIKECIRNDVEVLAVIRTGTLRHSRLPQSEYIETLECDLDKLSRIKERNKTYDVLFHFAWAYTSKETRDDPVLQEKNIRYTLDAVALAVRLGCRKFIGAGSQAEYGPKDCVITPETEINPQISYGAAKYAAGYLSRKLCMQYGVVHIWGRIFSVYGKYDNEGTMLSYAIDQFIKGKTARFSSAVQMWDYLYEDDAGKIFYLLGEYIEENKVYCVANGTSRPLKEFILEMKEAFGPEAKCEFSVGAEHVKAGLQPDVSMLFHDIAYSPGVKFKDGIKKMIEHRREMYKEIMQARSETGWKY